jgi:CRP-like cAMP-binding protein
MAMNAKVAYALPRYVADTLMRDLVGHDRRPSAFLVYLAIAAQAQEGVRSMSHRELAEFTGLSRRSVQDAVAHLKRRGLIAGERKGPTEAARYRALTPWKRN